MLLILLLAKCNLFNLFDMHGDHARTTSSGKPCDGALLLPSDLIERLETMVFLKRLMHSLFNLRKSLADQPQPFQLNQPYLGLTHSGSFLGLSNSTVGYPINNL